MIKKIDYIVYRKLQDISLEFSPYINLIAGTNGTCKTSILHTVSNSFQTVASTVPWLNDKKSISIIKKLNKLCNPKIETLTRGDREFNDPSQGVSGTLFTTNYINDETLSFRKHNSQTGNNMRFSVKPRYKSGGNESLPALPTIYLGLFRLFAYGEFDSDDLVHNISYSLPDKYLEDLSNLYKEFTGFTIEFEHIRNMGNIKNRPEFKTEYSGIDSNTISAGEDNLFIILLALVSLKYYFESIDSTREIESIFLIDEIDASLHPEFQIKLFKLFAQYSEDYKIQIFFTTHSMTLIEHALIDSKKCKTIYLLDQINNVKIMDDPDKYKIEMLLKNVTRKESYLYNKIPIITEDAEARLLLNLLLSHYGNTSNQTNLDKFFHLVNANLPSEAIVNLTNDDFLLKSTLRTINILDGDQESKTNLNKHLITLPGSSSPENMAFIHAENLLNNRTNDDFWNNSVLINEGITKVYFQREILPELRKIDKDYKQLKQEGHSTKGFTREQNKRLFNSFENFWKFVLKDWIESEENQREVNKFYKNLRILFLKTAEFHNINSNDWEN